MYTSFKFLKKASNILDSNGESDVICFNAMIDGGRLGKRSENKWWKQSDRTGRNLSRI